MTLLSCSALAIVEAAVTDLRRGARPLTRAPCPDSGPSNVNFVCGSRRRCAAHSGKRWNVLTESKIWRSGLDTSTVRSIWPCDGNSTPTSDGQHEHDDEGNQKFENTGHIRGFSRNSGSPACARRRPPSPLRGHGRQAHVATLGSGRGMVLEWARRALRRAVRAVYEAFPSPAPERAGAAIGASAALATRKTNRRRRLRRRSHLDDCGNAIRRFRARTPSARLACGRARRAWRGCSRRDSSRFPRRRRASWRSPCCCSRRP